MSDVVWQPVGATLQESSHGTQQHLEAGREARSAGKADRDVPMAAPMPTQILMSCQDVCHTIIIIVVISS